MCRLLILQSWQYKWLPQIFGIPCKYFITHVIYRKKHDIVDGQCVARCPQFSHFSQEACELAAKKKNAKDLTAALLLFPGKHLFLFTFYQRLSCFHFSVTLLYSNKTVEV